MYYYCMSISLFVHYLRALSPVAWSVSRRRARAQNDLKSAAVCLATGNMFLKVVRLDLVCRALEEGQPSAIFKISPTFDQSDHTKRKR